MSLIDGAIKCDKFNDVKDLQSLNRLFTFISFVVLKDDISNDINFSHP